MKTVHKFAWHEDGKAEFMMTRGAEILCVQNQNEIPCIWAAVDTDEIIETRKFVYCGTGHPAPEGKYIGTALFRGGDLVFHFFDVTEQPKENDHG